MNRKQLVVLWATVAVIVAMCVVPPWVGRYKDNSAQPRGYYLIFSPPRYDSIRLPQPDGSQFVASYRITAIDIPRLSVQVFAAVVVGTGAVVTLRRRQ